MLMNGAKAVIESLKKEGVEVIFGYPGGTVLTLYNEVYKDKFPNVLTGHEQGAVHGADGYAKATGKVGVCFATSGPGVCNMVTGIATAYMDSVPLVVISGQVATHLIGRDSFQEADISGITTPITKHNYLVKNVHELPRVLKEAFFIARSGRPGPVLVDVAKDVFDAEFDYEYPETVQLRGYTGHYEGNESDLDEAVKALGESRRPVLLTGGGIVSSDTAQVLQEVVEKLQIPVVTTLMGKGAIPDTYDYHLGMAGMHGTVAANRATVGCDLLLAIGTRFDDRVTGNANTFAARAKIIHFDIDRVEINKIVHSHVSVNGDLRWSLPLLAQKIQSTGDRLAEQYAAWRQEVRETYRAYPCYSRDIKNYVSPRKLMQEVRKRVGDSAIIATDVGQHQMWAAQFYDVTQSRHFLTSGGLGTMGYGLPAAMGAQLGCPSNQVVLFSGDGSIRMNCQELETLANYHIPVKIVVLRNGVLGMVNQWQRMFYEKNYAASVLGNHADMPAVATAMGVKAFAVHDPGDLEEGLDAFFAVDGPAFIEVDIPPDENVYPMVPGGKKLDEMIIGGDDDHETTSGTAGR